MSSIKTLLGFDRSIFFNIKRKEKWWNGVQCKSTRGHNCISPFTNDHRIALKSVTILISLKVLTSFSFVYFESSSNS